VRIWAEVGQCEGDINYALEAVEAVDKAGADAVKVQVLRPEWIAAPDAKRYDAYGAGLLQRDAFARYLDYDAWAQVATECKRRGLEFIAAVFDEEAAKEMSSFSDALKIASGDITNRPLIETVAHEARNMVLSTGASDHKEVMEAVHWIQRAHRGINLTLLACHLQYPTHIGDAHIGRVIALGNLIHSLGWKTTMTGYSDHTPGTDLTPLLVAMGVSAQEKHFTLWGPGKGGDHEFAVTPEELRKMVEARDSIFQIFGDLELEPTVGERAAREGARRSIHALRDIKKGEKITRENTAPLRPFVEDAVSPAEWDQLIRFGSVTMEAVAAGAPVKRRLVGNAGASLSVE
jgi:N,N'-diacetyllegionaminate synthase